MHLASLVDDFRAHSGEIAVVAHRGNRRYATTYEALAQLAGRCATELDRRGIAPGERVVLWGENSAHWIAAFFGCLLRGVLVVPLDAAGSSQFAARVVADVSPRLIVADTALLRSLPTDVPSLVFAELPERLPTQSNFEVSEAVNQDAAFQIVFTSGTTSEPKGIVHTHRNVLASLRPIEAEIAKYRKYERWVHPLRFLHTLPLSHVFGQFLGLWVPAILAAEVHFSDVLDPARTIELIRRERISVLVAVPRMLALLREHLLRRFNLRLDEARGLPVLKRWWRFRAVHRAFGLKFWALICGGASLPPELERFWNTLGLALIQGYGMTETAALVTLNHPFRIGQGTIGKALPGREVRLSDAGEILVRGEMVASATWQRGGMHPRQEEWLATGDLAEASPGGDLRFVGRKGDAIVTSSGLNIYPSDLETAIARQSGVRGCVVVPCESATGMEPVAVLLFQGDDDALQQAVLAANAELAQYQQVRRALRWPQLDFPYTSTGKLLRREIAQWTCAAEGVQTDGDPLLALIAEVNGGPVSNAGDSLSIDLPLDAVLDSLGRVQLASVIEQRMGLEVSDEQIAQLNTLGDLRMLVDGAAPGRTLQKPLEPSADGVAASPDPHVYPRWPFFWPIRLLRALFLEALMRPLVRALAAPSIVIEAHQLPPGPLLIIANHVTAYDGALVLYALPGRLRRRVASAMSGEMLLDFRRARGQTSVWRNALAPAAYWLLTALFNVFPLPGALGFRRSFAHAGELMDEGYSVLLFPEGRRSRAGEMQVFRPGIGLLAQQSRVPVLPVALLGMGEVGAGNRPGSRPHWFRSGKLQVRIGEAITLPEGTTPSEWTGVLEAALRRLLTTQ